jgi:putative aminopeptidase FrvX
MQQDSFDFLKQLVDTPGPSGYEQRVQRVFRDQVAAYAADVHPDILGNVYAAVNPGGTPSIMLAGHADEIGNSKLSLVDFSFRFEPIT